MMASPDTPLNVAICAVRPLEAFSKGDLDALREIFSPDIVWHVSGNHPLSGDYRGIEDHRVTEAWIVPEDQKAGDEFFA